MESEEVIEGFICPICKSDQGNPNKLLRHFQVEHSEDQDLIKTFKDLLDKAKKKILKQDIHSEVYTQKRNFENAHHHQEPGLTKSHFVEYSRIREERVQRLAVPTNRIVIRLEKLLEGLPSDPTKRRCHEMMTVDWADGSSVPRCPSCAGSFHVARRRHHCRTCGGIMCADCSRFMSIATARKLLEKVPTESSQQEQHLRLCLHCINMLEVREERRDIKLSRPIISQFYERLSDYRSQVGKLIIEYNEMANSLNLGESKYNLSEAETAKIKLLKLAESVDLVSKRISVLGRDSDSPPNGPALRIQSMVREASAAYLRNNLLNLPQLPTVEQLEMIQNRRREEITARINEEKMKAAKNLTKSNGNGSQNGAAGHIAVAVETPLSKGQGWVPETKKINESDDDPIIEQMNIIRSYIKEAKLAQKLDEVESLEENLRELKKEFLKKQNEEISSFDSFDGSSISSGEGKTKSESTQ